jgi:hypothetical protein
MFEIGQSLVLVRAFTIISSSTSLALVVGDYSSNKQKSNPVSKQLTLLGEVAVLLSKVPSIFSRCLVLAIFFSSFALQGKTFGFVYLLVHIIAFAIFEGDATVRQTMLRNNITNQ